MATQPDPKTQWEREIDKEEARLDLIHKALDKHPLGLTTGELHSETRIPVVSLLALLKRQTCVIVCKKGRWLADWTQLNGYGGHTGKKSPHWMQEVFAAT